MKKQIHHTTIKKNKYLRRKTIRLVQHILISLLCLFLLLTFILPDYFTSPHKYISSQLTKLNNQKNYLCYLNTGYRQNYLYDAYLGLKITGLNFVGFMARKPNKDGTVPVYLMEDIGDDLGHYYFIPNILHMLYRNKILTFSYVSRFQIFFFISITIISIILSYAGFCMIFKNLYARSVIIVGLTLFACFSLFILDIYTMQLLAVSLIPLFIALTRKAIKTKKYNTLTVYSFLSGLLIALSNCYRAQSGSGALIFLSIYLLILSRNKISLKNKLYIYIILLTGIFVFNYTFKTLIEHRNTHISHTS